MAKRSGLALVAAVVAAAWFGASPAFAGTPQTITFPPPGISPYHVGDVFSLSGAATTTSPLTVTFSIDSASSADCQITGGNVHFNGPGTCIVDANQAGDATYDPAPTVKVSILVVKKQQSITFVPPATTLLAGQPYAPTATASSGLAPVFFSIDPLSQGCLLSMGMVTLQGNGICIVDADQPGDATWAPAPTAKMSLVAGKQANTINFPLFLAPAPVGSNQPLGATAPSMDQIVYTVDPASTGCTLQFNPVPLVVFNTRGTCIVNADDPGNNVFGPAPRVTRTTTIVGGPQQVSFTSVPSQPGFAGSNSGVTAQTTGGPPPVLSLDPTSTGCSLLGQSPLGGATQGSLSFDSPGLCVIDANSPATPQLEAAPQAQVKLVIAKRGASLQFDPPNLPLPAHPGESYQPSAKAFSLQPSVQQIMGVTIVYSIDASSGGACHLAGPNVVFDAIGTCVVDADKYEDPTFAAAPTVKQTIVVAGRPQTVRFTSPAPTSPGHINGTYQALAASFDANNMPTNLPVSLTVDPTSTGCSIDGSGLVTFLGLGVCIIDANQAGDSVYAPAHQSKLLIPIVGNTNAISFDDPKPAQPAVVGTTDTIHASASSGDTVQLTLDPASAGCTLHNGNQVTYTGPGLCIVHGDDPGNGSYGPAPQVTLIIQIARLSQTITFSSVPPNPGAVGDHFLVAATASSGLVPVIFTLDPSSSGCTLSGATVTFTAPGVCAVDADQAGNSTYNAAPTAQQKINVQGAQTITFDSAAPAPGLAGNTYHILAHTSAPGIVVTFSLDASSAGCTIAGGIVTFTAQGTCIIDANAPGNSQYAPAPTAIQTIQVIKASQTISFTSGAPSPGLVGKTYTVSASSSAGLTPVTFTLDPASTGCSINGPLVTFTSLGTCIILAKQAGNGSYNPGQASQLVNVAQGPQTISFSSTPPSPGIVGTTYTASATATSGLPVSLGIEIPQSLGVCTMVGNVVTFVGAGTCLVDASQLGDANWASAQFVQQVITVKLPQAITFDSAAPVKPPVGTTYPVAAHSDSGLTVTFSVSGGACTIAGNLVTFTRGGTCDVNANQAGNAVYAPAPQKTQRISPPKPQTVTIASVPPVPAIVGGTYRVTAIASSGLVVKLTLDGTSTGCTLSAATVTFTGLGTCVVDANQPGNATWAPAAQKQQLIAVKKPQTISFTSAAGIAHVGGTYTPTATATSGLAVIFTLRAGSTCSIAGGLVTFVARGTCTIVANQPGDANWAPATAFQAITVRR